MTKANGGFPRKMDGCQSKKQTSDNREQNRPDGSIFSVTNRMTQDQLTFLFPTVTKVQNA